MRRPRGSDSGEEAVSGAVDGKGWGAGYAGRDDEVDFFRLDLQLIPPVGGEEGGIFAADAESEAVHGDASSHGQISGDGPA